VWISKLQHLCSSASTQFIQTGIFLYWRNQTLLFVSQITHQGWGDDNCGGSCIYRRCYGKSYESRIKGTWTFSYLDNWCMAKRSSGDEMVREEIGRCGKMGSSQELKVNLVAFVPFKESLSQLTHQKSLTKAFIFYAVGKVSGEWWSLVFPWIVIIDCAMESKAIYRHGGVFNQLFKDTGWGWSIY